MEKTNPTVKHECNNNRVHEKTTKLGTCESFDDVNGGYLKSMPTEDVSIWDKLDYSDDPLEDMDEDEIGDNEYYEDFEEHDRFGGGWDDFFSEDCDYD